MSEENEWPEQIYTIATNDKLLGGKGGPLNKASEQLDTRTTILKQSIDNIKTDLGSGQTGAKISKLETDLNKTNTLLTNLSDSAAKNYTYVPADSTGQDLIKAEMSKNDGFRIRVGSIDGKEDCGYAELATSDNGNEPIYIRQYSSLESDMYGTLNHSATLLDDNGNTSFPGTVTAPNFNGKIDIYSSVMDGPDQHNCFYRGKDLTESFNNGTMSANIANGTFKDIFPGDYIIKTWTFDGVTYTNCKWIIGHCDYYGPNQVPSKQHHVLVFPVVPTMERKYFMNPSNTTDGGYLGSYAWKTLIPMANAAIQASFTDNHIVKYNAWLTSSMNPDMLSMSGAGLLGSTNGAVYARDIISNLFSLFMLKGISPGASFYEVRNQYGGGQVAAFKFGLNAIDAQQWYLLRTIATATYFFCYVDTGAVDFSSANSMKLRFVPYFCLK